jgi:hypothetical protein
MVFRNGGLIEIERDVERWVQILGTIEPVLITAWNPIGVPASWADEYRRYVSRIHSLLTSEVTDTEIAEELLRIETGQMGLRGSSLEHRLDVVRQLRHAVTGISSS